MLWPLADRPRLAPGVPGGTIPVRLMDDELATSLATGGRLDVLLSAAEFATSRDVDPDGAVSRSLCLAVDPDLLVTVNAMTGGYVVSNGRPPPPPTAPAQQPGTPTHPGTGQAAAANWLNRLRALAHRMCVAPLPYAQADLDAVQRVGDTGLSAIATTSAGDVVDQILGVTAVRGATLIPDGSLTRRTVDLLNANGNTVVIAAADFAAEDSATPHRRPRTPHRGGCPPQVVVAPFDPAVGAAFAATGSDPVAPTYLNPALAVRLAARLRDRSPSGRARLDAVAGLAARVPRRAPRFCCRRPLEAATRGRGRHPDHAGDRDPLRPGGAATAAGADRRRHGRPRRSAGTPEPPASTQPNAAASMTRVISQDRRRGGPAVGADRGVDDRCPYRADRRQLHRAAARGHAARGQPGRTARHPQRAGATAVGGRRHVDQRLVRRGHHRQPGRVLHAGHRTQPAAAGPAQRVGRSDPGPTARRRPARDERDRSRRTRDAAGIPAAAGADRSELHPARRDRRHVAHSGRCAVGRAGAAVGALQRLRQGAVRDHAERGGGAGGAGRTTAVAPVPRPAGPRRPGPAGSARPAACREDGIRTTSSTKSTAYEFRRPARPAATGTTTVAAACPAAGIGCRTGLLPPPAQPAQRAS